MTETGRFLVATDRQTGGDNPYRAVDATPALRRPSAQKPGGPRRAAPNAQLVGRLPLLYHSGDTETNGPAGANPSPTPMQAAVARRETPPPLSASNFRPKPRGMQGGRPWDCTLPPSPSGEQRQKKRPATAPFNGKTPAAASRPTRRETGRGGHGQAPRRVPPPRGACMLDGKLYPLQDLNICTEFPFASCARHGDVVAARVGSLAGGAAGRWLRHVV